MSGAFTDGDYVHRTLLLLDRRDGSVHAMGLDVDSRALPDAALADIGALTAGLSVPGEGFVRFVQWGGAEYLIVDQLLVTPGGATVNLLGTPIL